MTNEQHDEMIVLDVRMYEVEAEIRKYKNLLIILEADYQIMEKRRAELKELETTTNIY